MEGLERDWFTGIGMSFRCRGSRMQGNGHEGQPVFGFSTKKVATLNEHSTPPTNVSVCFGCHGEILADSQVEPCEGEFTWRWRILELAGSFRRHDINSNRASNRKQPPKSMERLPESNRSGEKNQLKKEGPERNQGL